MKLHISPASPFVRKVRVLIRESGLLDRIEEHPVTVAINIPSSPTMLVNPLGKIPTLERPDGPAIYDSRVICRYLDDLSGAGLYPQTRLWETLTIEATADGLLDAAVAMVYEKRFRPAEKVDADWLEAYWGKVARSLHAMEERWMSHLAGPLDMAQIAVGCALGYLDFRHADRPWRQTHPELAAWYETFHQRSSMVQTHPEV
ncbi:MAG: glutathione S-transferase [Pseudomonadota bacterium]